MNISSSLLPDKALANALTLQQFFGSRSQPGLDLIIQLGRRR